jgi:hypothetical protein
MQSMETKTTVHISYSETDKETLMAKNLEAMEKISRIVYLMHPKFDLTAAITYYVMSKVLDAEMRERNVCFVSMLKQVEEFAHEQEERFPVHIEILAER